MNFTLLGADTATALQRTQMLNFGANAETAEVKRTQEKIKFALVDSGMGGGMAAALLSGEVRQLGSYFCLPIGEKSPKIAAAYTAAMALWPLISPLANSKGENDGRVAENVIIACNSASVRKEDAIAAMADFCAQVKSDPAKFAALGDAIVNNIVALSAEIEKNPDHLSGKVHEIVSKTVEVGVERAIEKFETQEDPVYVRIDSTAGTVQSNAYIDGFEKNLINEYADRVTAGETREKLFHDDNGELIGHIKVKKFTIKLDDGRSKTIFVENRGNPKWVPEIEGEANKEELNKLAKQSSEFSKEAMDAFGFTDLSERSPDLNMLCCTHYPAMKDSIRLSDGESVNFLDQSEIVRTIVHDLDGYEDTPGSPLQLALTVGSQNEGGAPACLKKSVSDGEKTANTLKKVIDTTRNDSKLNSLSSKVEVTVHHQGRTDTDTDPYYIYTKDSEKTSSLEEIYQCMHQYIGLVMASEILSEQSLERKDGKISALSDFKRAQPKITADNETLVTYYDKLQENELISAKFKSLGNLLAKSDVQGLDVLSLYNDQTAQLQAAVAQIAAVIERNTNAREKERVGILTGLSVIDSATGQRVAGEIGGLAGAAVLARTLLLQGLPVTLVTDQFNEASLVEVLLGAGLVSVSAEGSKIPADKRTLAHIDIADVIDGHKIGKEQLEFELPTLQPKATEQGTLTNDRDALEQQCSDAIQRTADALTSRKVNTMISIEHPDITQADARSDREPRLNVSSVNLDMTPLLSNKNSISKPFTIGIGDGGILPGTGGVQSYMASARDERLQPLVNRRSAIAAKKDLGTDVMLVSAVPSHGGVALSMAIDAGLKVLKTGSDYALEKQEEKLLDNTIVTYNATVNRKPEEVLEQTVLPENGPSDNVVRNRENTPHNDPMHQFRNVFGSM